MDKIALVTGANRGIGFEVCRQLAHKRCQVILTSRNILQGQEKAKQLTEEGFDVIHHPLDVNLPNSIDALRAFLIKNYGRIDILVNNAAILVEEKLAEDPERMWHLSLDMLDDTMHANVYGPFLLCQALIPLMIKQGYGRVVNVSSEAGQLATMGHHYPIYGISKAALNGVTRVFASRVAGSNVLVNSVCPGWVKTEMGGPLAPRSVSKGAEGIVWAALLPQGGPNGGFFRDGQPLAW